MTVRIGGYAAIAFKKLGGTYRGSTPLRDIALLRNDPAHTMRAATDTYQGALREIRQWQGEVELLRQCKMPLPARKAWELGNIVHRLNEDLATDGCQLESTYDHLKRHAGLAPKWLGGYVALRRYVDDVNAIPPGLKWNSIIKSVKSAGQAIDMGRFVEA